MASSDPGREAQARGHISYSQQKIDEYLKTREIGSTLSLDATLAVLHSENNWERILPAYAEHERKNFAVYREIADAVYEIQLKMKEFEFKHWMGFHDDDVKELLVLYDRREKADWRTLSEAEQTLMRELWDPHDYQYMCTKKERPLWKKQWQKYHDRRVRKPLQDMKGAFASTEGDVLEHLARIDGDARAAMGSMKVLTGSSAGRVLITMQDRFSQHDPNSIYGGAWVTLIFDETSPWPRGGVQGHCGTKEEILSLIQACIDYMPELTSDNSIAIC